MKYFIAVEIDATCPVEDLKAALQCAYDGGAAGHFTILVTRAPTHLVVFERDGEQDGEYVSKRADNGDVSIEKAAMQQLAAELTDGGSGTVAQPIVEELLSGDAQCFDYGIGAFEAMAEFMPEAESL